jgi:hypothetical protein
VLFWPPAPEFAFCSLRPPLADAPQGADAKFYNVIGNCRGEGGIVDLRSESHFEARGRIDSGPGDQDLRLLRSGWTGLVEEIHCFCGLLSLTRLLLSDSTVHNENSIQRFPVKRHIVTSRSPS